VNRNLLILSISCLCFLFLGGGSHALSTTEKEDPLERRVEKIETFRKKRDLFFKEDPASPLKEDDRKRFRGLSYYPIHLSYAMVGRIERVPQEPKPLYVTLPTNDGKGRRYINYGRFRFRWEGKDLALQVYRSLAGEDLFLPFKDKTSGVETYPEGRYLFIEMMPDEKVLIDFNRAYNPFCEYNKKYICPIAPKENGLEVPVRAGEKRFR
jgi:uncharacterized protein (DUF1684 family)